MFYSNTFLARKGPLGTVWCAAHLQNRLKKSHITATNIPKTVGLFLFFSLIFFFCNCITVFWWVLFLLVAHMCFCGKDCFLITLCWWIYRKIKGFVLKFLFFKCFKMYINFKFNCFCNYIGILFWLIALCAFFVKKIVS